MIRMILQSGTKATGLMLAITLLAALFVAWAVRAPLFQLKKISSRGAKKRLHRQKTQITRKKVSSGNQGRI